MIDILIYPKVRPYQNEMLPRDASLASIHQGEGGHVGNVVGALTF